MIAVLSDTHMPKGARRLPPRCSELLAEAEAVIHAGDFVRAAVLEEIEELCPTVHAVHGNVDEPSLRRLLPASLEVELGPRTVAVVHDAGPRAAPFDGAAQPEGDDLAFEHVWLEETESTR